MKTKLLMIATGMLTLFGLCSCFQVESTITLKKDGSGTITEELMLGEQMITNDGDGQSPSWRCRWGR